MFGPICVFQISIKGYFIKEFGIILHLARLVINLPFHDKDTVHVRSQQMFLSKHLLV